jgi:hypothetical protein
MFLYTNDHFTCTYLQNKIKMQQEGVDESRVVPGYDSYFPRFILLSDNFRQIFVDKSILC